MTVPCYGICVLSAVLCDSPVLFLGRSVQYCSEVDVPFTQHAFWFFFSWKFLLFSQDSFHISLSPPPPGQILVLWSFGSSSDQLGLPTSVLVPFHLFHTAASTIDSLTLPLTEFHGQLGPMWHGPSHPSHFIFYSCPPAPPQCQPPQRALEIPHQFPSQSLYTCCPPAPII